MTEEKIKHMVDRFLGWKLPANFNPDNGISFDRTVPHPACQPVGTNLLDAQQAEAMVRYLVEGIVDDTANGLSSSQQAIHDLIAKAKGENDSGDAMRFCQAAANAAQALGVLNTIKA